MHREQPSATVPKKPGAQMMQKMELVLPAEEVKVPEGQGVQPVALTVPGLKTAP